MNGGGKYEEAARAAREACGPGAEVVLIVFQGHDGPGFEVQASAESVVRIPAILMDVAVRIQHDLVQAVRSVTE